MALRDVLPFRLLAPTGTILTLGAIVATVGTVLGAVSGWSHVPDASGLVSVSGRVATVAMLDDLSGTPIGPAAPGMTSIHVTLDGVAGTFRYPSGFPRYFQVYQDLVGQVTLWVEVGTGPAAGARTIWGIDGRAWSVGRDEVIATVRGTDAANRRAATWLTLGGGVLLILGCLGLRWNASQPSPSAEAIDRFEHGREIVGGWFLDVAALLERGYELGERAFGALLGGALGRGLWRLLAVGVYAIGLIAVGAWLY